MLSCEIYHHIKAKKVVYYSIPRKYSTVDQSFWSKIDSDAGYFPVDLTGNVNMVRKLFLGGTGTGDLPILSPMR